MNLLGASLKARETEIIPNVFPLDPEPKEQDMQEKKAATEGEEAMMIHKLLENQRMFLTALNPHSFRKSGGREDESPATHVILAFVFPYPLQLV